MGGPAAHGQHNKPHKRGRTAGASARNKHKLAKEGGRQHVKSGAHTLASAGKMQRLNEAKQLRERKKNEVMAQRRQQGPPPVVAFLPLSEEVDFPALWRLVLSAFAAGPPGKAVQPKKKGGAEDMEADEPSTSGAEDYPLVPTTVAVPGRAKQRFTFLPPPSNRGDPLAAVELGKTAELVVAVLPAKNKAVCIDSEGQLALSTLRQLGMPAIMAVVAGGAAAAAGAAPGAKPAATANRMKERAGAKKRAAAVLASEVPGDHKVVAVDDEADCTQFIRNLTEVHPSAPLWRRQRPCLLVDAAHFFPAPDEVGTLTLRGYVRHLGLSANQIVHVPGAGDFQIERIEGTEEPAALGAAPRSTSAATNDDEMDASRSSMVVLPDPTAREEVIREKEADPLAGEQTWPTDMEMLEAEQQGAKKRRLPRGTSEYQAAWITDDIIEGDDDVSEEEGNAADEHDDVRSLAGGRAGTEAGGLMSEFGGDDTDDMAADLADDEDGDEADHKQRWREQQDDIMFPDEVDTPRDVAARVRFAKYRGLKSWRSSAWDPKEGLPREYARVFAFQNPKRAHKRAKAAAEAVGGPGDAHGVPAGAYVTIHLARVPTAAAAAVVARVASLLRGELPPLAVFGLLQHETKLSVVNFSVRKAAALEEPLPNKSELLLVTGLRSYVARPIFSTDEPSGSRFKMERFLHPGRQTVLSVYGPICFGPLPVLAFLRAPDGSLRLAASGTLRGCDPDRLVIKKVVLSGYPVKVHKKKAFVRWMFFGPEDVRWFRPVELWTKHGRRGRIKEPMGTHGTMKCLFDGPVTQQDAVCMSLYKRTFPPWPENMSFS
ncbi:g9397 [Coccomyxa elongata]